MENEKGVVDMLQEKFHEILDAQGWEYGKPRFSDEYIVKEKESGKVLFSSADKIACEDWIESFADVLDERKG